MIMTVRKENALGRNGVLRAQHDGGDALTELKRQHHAARYLLVSGGLDHQRSVTVPFVAKPFTPAQLMVAIETVIAKTPSIHASWYPRAV